MNKKQTAIILSILGLFGMNMNAGAITSLDDIRVVGLFKDAAVLNINDQRKLLRVGSSHRDIRLLAANSEKAMIEIQGRRLTLSMAGIQPIQIGHKSEAGSHQAHLISNGGLYSVTGSVNGQLADFVVDTGASYITMSAARADSLRLDYSNAQKVMMNTANGKTTAHVFTIKSVQVGGIELENVQAAVMHNMDDQKILLGMSFLGKVDMQHNNGLMVLRQRN